MIPADDIRKMDAQAIAKSVASGRLTAQSVAEAFLARIAAVEPQVQAWTHLEPETVLRSAHAIDATGAQGPLAGVPIGVKDVIETVDMPTGYGSAVYAGHRPAADAPCVALTRAANGLVLGKTVSTEFAMASPGSTRNPWNTGHTPGGSSSGSSAAVAAGMAVMAFGTQTSGSIIRPASYCGVVGYKPSFGTMNSAGIKVLAQNLDTLGMAARSVRDAAWCTSVIARRPELAVDELPGTLRVGVFMTSSRQLPEPAMQAAIAHAASRLGTHAQIVEIPVPGWFEDLQLWQDEVFGWEVTSALAHERIVLGDRISPVSRDFLARKALTTFGGYQTALRGAAEARARFADLIAPCDVLLTPAAPGAAPKGLAATGSPYFNGPWSLLHTPCLTLPAMLDDGGLPLGVQLVGRIGDDARLLAAAALAEALIGFEASAAP